MHRLHDAYADRWRSESNLPRVGDELGNPPGSRAFFGTHFLLATLFRAASSIASARRPQIAPMGGRYVKFARAILAAISILPIIVVAAFFTAGPPKVWSMFGPADLGPVVFERLERRGTPNDALACPADRCQAGGDVLPPRFTVNVRALRAAMANVIASESNITLVAADDATRTERYVQRSALLGFPDTIVVRYLELPGERSTLAIYSRSQLGRSDLGANRRRIERWLTKLEQHAPTAE